jgi:uncharacterized membrane protein
VLIAHAGATFFMTGLIWLVQWVHYPLFARVGADGFGAYHEAHMRLITPVVLPVMGIELVTGAWLLWSSVPHVPRWIPGLAFALLVAVWLVTFLHSVPRHELLTEGFRARTHAELVAGNWWRTLGWTARSGLWAYALASLLRRAVI